ncbi:hypothetical protein EN829_034885 [Mesorhizobium sp. M00.F.Ca.ET.186.01.1.1]|nr:hypothetical protein EN829_034885 [Mesorhizobium sp. M00.F.Ca.ET.186.01.1.1]
METAVVVGGGIAGLLSSILLKEKYEQVFLVERGPECGGLLRSFENKDGVSFDLGTHVLKETGIAPLDELLFSNLQNDEWSTLDYLKVGNYFEGKLNKNSQFINTKDMPTELYQKGLVELLHTKPITEPPHHLQEYLVQYFGETFTQHIFKPLMKKLQGASLEELHHTAHILFGYSRLIGGDAQTSRELKTSPFYDGKLAFASYLEGSSHLKNFYPRTGGIGKWVHSLEKVATERGVTILTSESVEVITRENKHAREIVLQSGKKLACDMLVWTIAPFLLLKSSGVQMDSKVPQFRRMSLHHYVFDRPFQTDNYYLYCNDPEMKSFRVTLYPNMRHEEQANATFNCTVEAFIQPDDTLQELDEQLANELRKMGIIDQDAQMLTVDSSFVPAGFPVLTKEYVELLQSHNTMVAQSFDNVVLLGKGNGSTFFMNDVLIEAFHTITNQLDTPHLP